MTHTKGEWLIKERENNFMVDVLANGQRICEVKSFTGKPFNDPSLKKADANAKLIAAAPDMLEALIEANNELKNMHEYISKVRKQVLENGIDCVSWVDIDDIDDVMLTGKKAEKAIDKATE